jgi:TolA-binding protein
MRKPLVGISLLVVLLSGCFKTRSDIAHEQEEDQATAQEDEKLSQRLDTLETQFGKFQGQVEEMQFQRKQETKDNRKLIDELNEKLAGVNSRMDMLFEEVKKMKEEPEPAKVVQKTETRVKKKSGGANVTDGIAAFKKKDFEAAATQFEAYLENYPHGKRVHEASFYLGEVRFIQKDYGRAILAYSPVHEKSPKNALWRKATMKIAECFANLGKKADAKSFAQLLVQAAPESAEAKKVRKILK